MSDEKGQPLGPSGDRIIILDETHGLVIEDMREIFQGSTFIYQKEINLQNTLLDAFKEMAFIVRQFEQSHTAILAHGTPDLAHWLGQLNELDPPQSLLFVELDAIALSTYFKSFLVLAKAVLDKLVPIYSYRFYDTLGTFSSKGDHLVARIKRNKHVQHKAGFFTLIEQGKRDWLDALVDLRDEYAHFSNLKEYRNFWLPGEVIGRAKIAGIQEFRRPTIDVGGRRLDALEYMLSVKGELTRFLRDFIQLCEFTPDRRPKRYLSCDDCEFEFARKTKGHDSKRRVRLLVPDIVIQIKDKARDYGVIVCPKCGGKTDTDLQFWREAGVIFSASAPEPSAGN